MKIIASKLNLLAVAAASSLVLMLATGSPPATAKPPADPEKAILARLGDMQNAAQAFDADKVFAFIMENNAGVIAQNGKVFLTRSNALESTRQGLAAIQNAGARIEYHFDQHHVTLLSPTIALAVSDGSTRVISGDGKVQSAPFAQSMVFVLTNGDWKLFHAHRSFVPPRDGGAGNN
jgi:ketosteroid isomerase-like protein